ncbi:uncharacterized protein LOC132700733 isoform X2 [Cylas formicarius]|uniref:uncharacterized protein LOC132700733 isoform X2 n=1 Tax=Cylas formicarius TaxID=197179 RepID=UPI002958C074|nr:uncharacterized protein LOC132700733 isoform X2 [Cylas formicarius]
MVDMNSPRNRTIFLNRPLQCPWITSQPYHFAFAFKNNPNELEKKNQLVNNSMNTESTVDACRPLSHETPIQQSSSHFFYFLRLMQLFPDTHPATLHSVLTLTKNNFFYAIDKLLYAKKCKSIYGKRHTRHSKNAGQNKMVNENYSRPGALSDNRQVAVGVSNRKSTEGPEEIIEILFENERGQKLEEVTGYFENLDQGEAVIIIGDTSANAVESGQLGFFSMK